MAYGIRTGDPRGFNKGRSSKFHESSRVQQTPEKGWRIYWLKHCENNNKDEDNSPKTLNDKKISLYSLKQTIYPHGIFKEFSLLNLRTVTEIQTSEEG